MHFTQLHCVRQSTSTVGAATLSYSDSAHYQTCDNNNMTQVLYQVMCFLFPLYVTFNSSRPPGFALQGDPPGCYCYPALTDNGVNAIFSEATLSWNTSLVTMSVNKIILSKHCPFDYCKDTKVIKGVSDDQCFFSEPD